MRGMTRTTTSASARCTRFDVLSWEQGFVTHDARRRSGSAPRVDRDVPELRIGADRIVAA